MMYNKFSTVYDKLMKDFDYDKVFHFMLEKTNLKEGSRVLELGCGTGELTKRLCKNFSVVALDLSSEMLSVADRKLRNKRVNLLNIDMRDINFNAEFDLVISACDSINYILDEKEIIDLFKSVKNSLVDNGYFLFDLNTEYKFKNLPETFIDEEDGVFYTLENYFDKESSINLYSVNFFVENEDKNYYRFYEEHRERAYERDFILNSLKQAGFKSVEIFSEYEDNINLENSDRLVYLARG